MRNSPSKSLSSRFSLKINKKQPIIPHDQKLLNLEQKQIAYQLGIDQSEVQKYKWLFEQIRYTQLPPNYTRILLGDQTTGKVKYLNLETKQQHHSSPLLGLFKKALYQKVDHSKAAYGFQDKARKLLPFMQDKLARQRIGLASKRKQAERVNLVRDEKGKVTTSKTVRLVPDTKKMLISRDYLLKMIVDKVITKGELFGRGKRARQFSILLQKAKKQRQVKEEYKQMSSLQIDEIQTIYQQATEYYLQTVGQILKQIPLIAQQSKNFKSLTPQHVVNSLTLLGVQKQRIQQYFFGKILNCLPLPPNWVELKGISDQPSYVYTPHNVIVTIHPSINYLHYQINQFRGNFSDIEESEKQVYYQNRQMSFIDFFDRMYKVDIFLLLSKQEEKKEEQHEIFHQQKINDWLILEAASLINLPSQHYHLTQSIQDYFTQTLDGTQLWYPQVSNFGEIIWTNTITTLCTSVCPIEKEINDEIRMVRENVPEIDDEKDYCEVWRMMMGDEWWRDVYQRGVREKRRWIEGWMEEKEYKVKEEWKDAEEMVLFCPFDLIFPVIDLQGATLPIWMQKTLSKSYHSLLKLSLSPSLPTPSYPSTLSLLTHYLSLLRLNPSWQTYFKQTLSTIQPNRLSLQSSIKHIFDYQERQRWFKFQNKNSREKVIEDMKNKYYESQKHLFKEPEVVIEEKEEQEEKEGEEDKSKSGDPTSVSTRKYYNIQSDYDYDKANRLINAIQQWSQADSTQMKSKQQKRYQNDQDMILITNQKQLDKQIKSLKKKSIKTKKFTSARLLEKINQTSNDYERIVYKNGLLKSKLRDETAAMNKKSREKFLRKEGVHKSRAQTSRMEGEGVSIQMFNSICSQVSNGSIERILGEKHMEERRKREEGEQEVESGDEEGEYIPIKVEQKRESIFNLPTQYPSILPLLKKKDPLFVHINQAKSKDFRQVFHRKQSPTPSNQIRRLSLHKYNKSTQNLSKHLPKPSTHTRFQSKLQKPINQLNPEMSKIRCLDSTCSHLLNSNVVSSKMVFDRLEIRKQLFLKNRGLKLIHI